MKILPISNIKFVNSSNAPIIKEEFTKPINNNNKEKNQNNIATKIAIGLGVANIVLTVLLTDSARIQKFIAKEQPKIKKDLIDNNLNIHIENFTNKKNIKSLSELSGLNKIKEIFEEIKILSENNAIMREHNVQGFTSILLWGVPGTGKSSAAKGIAKELNADFIKINKEIFDSMFTSEAPKNLLNLFEQIERHAKQNPNKKIVVFIDEIDGIMSVDKSINSRHNEDITNTLKNALIHLQEECENIIFIGATNKDPCGFKSDNISVTLNSAILSRFKYWIEVDLPKKKAINDAWSKLMKTASGKNKFTTQENDIISKHFYTLGMSYRDLEVIADKLNRLDATEFYQKNNYNSKENLIKVLLADEKIGYDFVKKQNAPKKLIDKTTKKLKKELNIA